jgi:predicted SprT family Zn-dependent metalloprotease
MPTKTLQTLLTVETVKVWEVLCEINPALVRFNEPTIKLNGRLWRTAGQCHQESNIIELGSKFFNHSAEYNAYMVEVILPHEIIHQADWNLYGPSELKCGHGVNWVKMMLEYGLPADKFHTMDIKR